MTSNLTTLKKKWQTSLTESDKAFWRQQLATPLATAGDLRNLLREKLNIALAHDSQLYEFRQWEAAQRATTIMEERLDREIDSLAEEYPDWTLDLLRAELLQRLCLQTAFSRPDALGLDAIRTVTRCRFHDLHRAKFKESLRSKVAAGIEAIRKEAGKNPRAQAAIDSLVAAVAPEESRPNN